ncbi:MAG TPA: hypothetical protein VGH33_12500 [Isosphaeraceae bacterium]|jgi:hypothetical protein
MAEIAVGARGRKKPAFLFADNRAEGNAPPTTEAVAQLLLPGY